MIKMKNRAVGLVVLAAVSGCSSKDARRPDLNLLDSQEQTDLAAEAQRLHDLQLVRVLDDENKPVTWETQELLEVLAAECGLVGTDAVCLAPHRKQAQKETRDNNNAPTVDPTDMDDSTQLAECGMLARECYGRSLMAAVNNPESVSVVKGGESFRLLPQSTATKAALAEQAASEFSTAMEWWVAIYFGYGVRKPNPNPILPDIWLGTPPAAEAIAKAQRLGWRFTEYYHLAREALDIAVENTVAAADAQLTIHSKMYQARGVAGAKLSRVAAAHLLVGGEPGLKGSTTEPFCTGSPLTGPAERALGVLRSAAPSPRDVTSNQIDIHTFLESATVGSAMDPSKPLDGSIRKRLEDYWDVALPINQELTSVYGLSELDFAQARSVLADEIRVFNRSKLATLPVALRHENHALEFDRFAATASPAPERGAEFWQAIASGSYETWQKFGSAPGLPPLEPGFTPYFPTTSHDVAHLADFAETFALRVLNRAEFALPEAGVALTADQQKIKEYILDPLGILATSRERTARVMQCKERGPDSEWKHSLLVFGVGATEGAIAVRGEDALSCATTGSVEGAPCSLVAEVPSGGLTASTFLVHELDVDEPAPLEFTKGAGVEIPEYTFLLSGAANWYVLRPRLSDADLQPGRYTSLAGIVPTHYAPGTSIRVCRGIPVVPEASERAKAVLAPSREWCGQQSVSCDGTRFDARMPLEDELSDDGDAVESSWRHYLTLARQAADQADALGRDYLDSSLAQDVEERDQSLRAQAQQERALAELEALQQICGTAVDPITLLESLGVEDGVFNLEAITAGACTGEVGEICIGERAVKDWETLLGSSDSELGRLSQCLQDFTATVPFAHLGDGYLCLSEEGVREDDADCDSDCTACVGPQEGLNFFPTEEPAGSTSTRDESLAFCDTVRELRKTPTEGNQERSKRLKAITSSTFFDPAFMAATANKLAIKLDYGDFVTLSTPSAAYTTMQADLPESLRRWPCAPSAANCEDGEGLFCEHIDCADPDERAEFSDRFYRAAVAAKLATWLNGMTPPSFPAPFYLSPSVQAHGASYEPAAFTSGGHAIDLVQNDAWRIFDGAVSTGAGAIGTSVGRPGNPYLLKQDGKRFAIGYWPFTVIKEMSPQFWGGLSSSLKGENGYFLKRLQGLNGVIREDDVRIGLPEYTSSSSRRSFKSDPFGTDPGLNIWINDSTGPIGSLFVVDAKLNESLNKHLHLGPSEGEPSLPVIEVDEACLDPFGWPCENIASRFQPGGFNGITFGWDHQDLLDGLELLCEARNAELGPAEGCENVKAPMVQSPQDLPQLSHYMECAGDEIKAKARFALFGDFPVAALDPLRRSASGPYTSSAGELDRQISLLRDALIQVAKSGPALGGTMHQYGSVLRQLQSALVQYDTQAKVNQVRFEAEAAAQAGTCLNAQIGVLGSVAGAVATAGAGTAQALTSMAMAVSTCSNAMEQIGFAEVLRDLGDETNESARQGAIAQFDERFAGVVEELETESLNLSQSLEAVSRGLGEIESLKKNAARSVQKALWLLSAQAANETEITNFMSNRSIGAHQRYTQALKNAKRLSFLARRAIENRLGHKLTNIADALPLVDAPAGWANTVCSMEGINYDTLTEEGRGDNFADGFIGDYVTKLENVVESYRLVNNFHEGTDVAVISLRDDVLGTKAACEIESRNLLFHASNLAMASGLNESPVVGWQVSGCTASPNGLRLLSNCVSVVERADAPFYFGGLGQVPLKGYTLQFAGGNGCSGASECGWAAGAGVSQTLKLTPGRYRFSWYTGDTVGTGGWLSAKVLFADGSSPAVTITETTPVAQAGDWHRLYVVFDVADEQDVTLSFQRPSASLFTAAISGPMLERLEDPFLLVSGANPQVFWDTGASRTAILPACEDTYGATFRSTKWRRDCLKLCPGGYQSECAASAKTECFRETSFHLSQRDLEAGRLFTQSGFARGNFNYRIETVGLNFVGTNLRACEGSDLPSTCYAAGYIPYSLQHDGPHYIRNEKGEDYLARLFSGQIEHARGLGTERYLTNPLGSSDRDLIANYLRTEFRGRPLDGSFVLRVWEEPGVDFEAIEDVQLVLNYRYWTRFD